MLNKKLNIRSVSHRRNWGKENFSKIKKNQSKPPTKNQQHQFQIIKKNLREAPNAILWNWFFFLVSWYDSLNLWFYIVWAAALTAKKLFLKNWNIFFSLYPSTTYFFLIFLLHHNIKKRSYISKFKRKKTKKKSVLLWSFRFLFFKLHNFFVNCIMA